MLTKTGGFVSAAAVRQWMGTLDYKAILHDPTCDPVRDDFRGPVIAVFWHEYMLLPFYLRGHSNSAILTSRHRDAEWLSESARHMGFETIRGSSSRGGSQALLEYMRRGELRNLGVACDGPRGPRRSLAQGPIYLSSRLQVPLVIYGIGYDRPWRAPTWDRFAIPRPWTRARLIVSERLQVPSGLKRQGVMRYCDRIEEMMLKYTFEAEAWAADGARRKGQIPLRRQPGSRVWRRTGATHTSLPHPWEEVPGRPAAASHRETAHGKSSHQANRAA